MLPHVPSNGAPPFVFSFFCFFGDFLGRSWSNPGQSTLCQHHVRSLPNPNPTSTSVGQPQIHANPKPQAAPHEKTWERDECQGACGSGWTARTRHDNCGSLGPTLALAQRPVVFRRLTAPPVVGQRSKIKSAPRGPAGGRCAGGQARRATSLPCGTARGRPHDQKTDNGTQKIRDLGFSCRSVSGSAPPWRLPPPPSSKGVGVSGQRRRWNRPTDTVNVSCACRPCPTALTSHC